MDYKSLMFSNEKKKKMKKMIIRDSILVEHNPKIEIIRNKLE